MISLPLPGFSAAPSGTINKTQWECFQHRPFSVHVWKFRFKKVKWVKGDTGTKTGSQQKVNHCALLSSSVEYHQILFLDTEMDKIKFVFFCLTMTSVRDSKETAEAATGKTNKKKEWKKKKSVTLIPVSYWKIDEIASPAASIMGASPVSSDMYNICVFVECHLICAPTLILNHHYVITVSMAHRKQWCTYRRHFCDWNLCWASFSPLWTSARSLSSLQEGD